MYTYLSLATCVSHCSLHVVVLPVYVVVFSSRCGWWKAPPVSPATSSKVQKPMLPNPPMYHGTQQWVGLPASNSSYLSNIYIYSHFFHFNDCGGKSK